MKPHGKLLKNKKNSKIKILCIILVIEFIIVAALLFIHMIWIRPPEMDLKSSASAENEVHSSDNSQGDFPEISSVASQNERKEKCYTFLIAASDQSSGNADVIMVLTYDTKNQKIGIVSIPRDTLVHRDVPKINSAYQSGVDTLQNVVSDLLGIPIDFYVTINVEGFVKLVDTVGGIGFEIPRHMSYDDPIQDLHIHFESGEQFLDGKQALEVCRWRKNNDGTQGYADSDIGRTETQQKLLLAIAKKILANPQKLVSYIDIFSEYVKTDLPLGNMAWFAKSALELDTGNDISTATLPGDGTVTYGGYTYCYQLYSDQVLEIVNTIINPYTEDITLDDMNIFEAP